MTDSLRILLLEDNPVDARIFRAQARSGGGPGVTVVETDSIGVAAERLAAEPFDVVVMNLGLKDSYGLDSLRRLVGPQPDMPIVVLTGADDERDALQAMKCGAQEYVIKGRCDSRQLMRTIRHAMERKNHEVEREKLQGQLAHATRLESLGQLAAGVAHEINTPIQFIGDNTRFLRDAFSDFVRLIEQGKEAALDVDLAWLKEEVPKAIAQTLDGVARVASIVSAMKQTAHPGGKEKQAVALNDVLQTAITLSRNEWKYHADIECALDPDLPMIDGLPGEINQVFLNLIVNAAHAIAEKNKQTGARGKISLSTKRDGERIVVRVGDTGGGIPDAIRARVFDPFFTTKEVGRGTGQGLAIAFNVVVKQHGGTIEFETTIGVGTTFVVSLPIHAPSAPPVLAPPAGSAIAR